MERKTQYEPFSGVNPKLEDWISNFWAHSVSDCRRVFAEIGAKQDLESSYFNCTKERPSFLVFDE